MAAQSGKDMLVKLDQTGSGSFLTVAGLRTRSLALNAHFDATYWMLISAHAHRGELGEAQRHLESLRRIAPGVSLASIRAGQPAKDPSRFAIVLEGLALAGLHSE